MNHEVLDFDDVEKNLFNNDYYHIKKRENMNHKKIKINN